MLESIQKRNSHQVHEIATIPEQAAQKDTCHTSDKAETNALHCETFALLPFKQQSLCCRLHLRCNPLYVARFLLAGQPRVQVIL